MVVDMAKISAAAAPCSFPARLQRLGWIQTINVTIAYVGELAVAEKSLRHVRKSGLSKVWEVSQ